MDSILPERLLALVRPAFDLVLRRIRSLKRCVQACGCKIMTPRYACKMPSSCVSARRANKTGKKRKPSRLCRTLAPHLARHPAAPPARHRSQPAATLAWNEPTSKSTSATCAFELSKFSTVYRQFTENFGRRAQVSLLTGAISNQIESHPTKKNLVRAWCGPGVGLVRAWCALACEGLLCQTHHPRITRITRKLLRTQLRSQRNRAPCGVRTLSSLADALATGLRRRREHM